MATSTLDPDNLPQPDRQLGKGHGTAALGPSDISDTGSDIQGAGPRIGDANIDSDTDAFGTGERATAGIDSDIEAGGDINVDHIDTLQPEENPEDIVDKTLPRSPLPHRSPQHR